MAVAAPVLSPAGARARISVNSRVPSVHQRMNIATSTPKSPTRLAMNAFLPASALAFSPNQKPISK
jgi:hypothetical protein